MAKKRAKAKKKATKSSTSKRGDYNPTSAEIVQAWSGEVESGLKTLTKRWTLKQADKQALETKLQNRIDLLRKRGFVFTKDDMKNSRQVARDVAKILRTIRTKSTTISGETLEAVVKVCARFHETCQTGNAGGGGWCDV